MCFDRVKAVLKIALRLVLKIGGPILAKLMQGTWEHVKEIVDFVALRTDITGEQKRAKAVELIKTKLAEEKKEIKDSAINFLVELAVLIKKYVEGV